MSPVFTIFGYNMTCFLERDVTPKNEAENKICHIFSKK